MVTLTSRPALYSLPPERTTAITLEVFATLRRVLINGAVPAGRLKLAASGAAFFSTNRVMLSTLASLVVTATLTTAPFSAIAGALTVTSLLAVRSELPSSPLVAVSTFLAWP